MAVRKITFGKIASLADCTSLRPFVSHNLSTLCAEMAAFFKTEFATDSVHVRALDKRSFGRVREIPRLNWPTTGLDRESLLELESLVESGAAKSTDLAVWISSDE